MMTFGPIQWVLVAILAILVIIFFYYVPFMLWINAVVSGVHVSLVQLFLMRIRKVPPTRIVNCLIEAHKAGLTDVKRDGLEAHFLAGAVVLAYLKLTAMWAWAGHLTLAACVVLSGIAVWVFVKSKAMDKMALDTKIEGGVDMPSAGKHMEDLQNN